MPRPRAAARYLAAALVWALTLALAPLLPGVAHAQPGALTVDNSGANGAVSGRIVDARPGSATLLVHNEHQFWTSVYVSASGVDLTPGPLLSGGEYAAALVIGPGETAAWRATYDPTKTVTVLVRATPYLFAEGHESARLAAALTILHVVTEAIPKAAVVKSQVAARAAALRDAARLVEGLLGDDLATVLTVERLVSGEAARTIVEALDEETQAAVMLEALGLIGVTTSLDDVRSLQRWIPFLSLVGLTFDLGMTYAFGTSTGAVTFASSGPHALPPLATAVTPAPDPAVRPTPSRPPHGSARPSTQPPSTARPSAPPPAPALSDVRITRVWTRDARGTDQTSFRCGDQVRLSWSTHNPNAVTVEQDVSALVEGPTGQAFYEEDRVLFAPGPGNFEWVMYLAADAVGELEYTADIFPNGELGASDSSAFFTVSCGG